MSKDLRGVLVGCGFMGGMHAQIYKALPGVEIVAAVDGRPEEAAKKLEELGCAAPVYETLAEALSSERCDFVDICLPTYLHKEFAIEAIEAGKNIFCEKPLALTVGDADAILTVAEKSGVKAQVGHCIRFWPEYQRLMEYHESGEGGKLLSLSLTRRAGRPGYGIGDWLNDERKSGGAALDLHIHDTDFALAMLGHPKRIRSHVTEDFSGPVHIFSLMDYDGFTVSSEGGWNYPKDWGFQMAFQAVYEAVVLDYDSSNGKGLTICEKEGAPRSLEIDKPDAGSSQSGEGNISDLGGYFNELEYFTNCLKKNVAPQKATLKDGRESLKLTLEEIAAARESV